MSKLTLTFLYMEYEHIGKDVTCVPYYLGKSLGYDVDIVSLTSATNRNFPSKLKGISFKFLFRHGDRKNGWYKLIFFWLYLMRNARRIDILMRFHYSIPTIIEVLIYKLFNKKGKVYIKCDTDHHIIEKFQNPNNIRERLKKKLYKKGIKKIDIISCETLKAYNMMTASKSPYFAFNEKLLYIPNGFDEQELIQLGGSSNLWQDNKQNEIITVGRLGTYQKNTEVLLETLAKTNLNDWKVYLIGPIEPNFQNTIDKFYAEHPDKRDSVIFTGPIYDKEKLWTWYMRAKVFVLTSRWESYGLVLTEARRFGCYIVSTDVGAAYDLIGNNQYGEYIKQDNSEDLQRVLQRIINGVTVLNIDTKNAAQELSWEHVLSPVIKKLQEK